MNEPCHLFEALIKAKRVTHGGHRVLRNHIEHVAVKTDDAGRIRPVKPKKTGKHIDGVVASLNALRMLATVKDAPRFQMFFAGPGRG
jgi:Phage terminase-like protein, large subunit